MNKHNQYVGAIALAIEVMETTFVRAAAAERAVPRLVPLGDWPGSAASDATSFVEVDDDALSPAHRSARLCLMSAYEALQAALRIVSSKSAREDPAAAAWQDAAVRATEAACLALEAQEVLSDSNRTTAPLRTAEAV